MKKNESYYSCLQNKKVTITKLEQLLTRYAIGILAMLLILVVLN